MDDKTDAKVEEVARLIARRLGHNDETGMFWDRYVLPAQAIVEQYGLACSCSETAAKTCCREVCAYKGEPPCFEVVADWSPCEVCTPLAPFVEENERLRASTRTLDCDFLSGFGLCVLCESDGKCRDLSPEAS